MYFEPERGVVNVRVLASINEKPGPVGFLEWSVRSTSVTFTEIVSGSLGSTERDNVTDSVNGLFHGVSAVARAYIVTPFSVNLEVGKSTANEGLIKNEMMMILNNSRFI